MNISVIIPTCNRRERLLSLLNNLNQSSYPVSEIIIIDSGENKLSPDDYKIFSNLNVTYITSEKSVCVQRNTGIDIAKNPWVFLCDDDIEIPVDYLAKINMHIKSHPDAVAISGLIMQLDKGEWKSRYSVNSTLHLLWNYFFNLTIWEEIAYKNNFISKWLKKYYEAKGNHISKAGWPVLTDFSGEYFVTPVFGLGASVIKKEWLQNFPYDEVLDSHGIGDHYGVAIEFPPGGIHVLNNAFVYHHQETTNRISATLQYYRRVLALDYFIKTRNKIQFAKRRWLVWSLIGNKISFLFSGNLQMMCANLKAIVIISFGQNPYIKAAKNKKKVTEPEL